MMKDIPHRTMLQVRPPVTPGDVIEEIRRINDDIIEAMHLGQVWPGDCVFHESRVITDEVKMRLEDRFRAEDWELHFKISASTWPSTTIYIAGAGAHYGPYICQPGEKTALEGLRKKAKRTRR